MSCARSAVDTILLAAYTTPGGASGHPVTAGELVVAAWRLDRHRFGLREYEAVYPDSNRVFCKLPAIERRGLIERHAPRVYRLTAAGREYAFRLYEKHIDEKTP